MKTAITAIDTASAITMDTKGLAATFVANAASFGDVKCAYLPLGLLYVNSDYQRPPQNKIAAIAADFDESKCGFLLVNYDKDAGAFAIVDGQNRFLAAKMAGKDCVPCQIMNLDNAKQEAYAFAKQNENQIRVSCYDKFKASLYAEDPTAIRISEICRKHNVVLNRTSNHYNKTRSIYYIIKVYQRGEDVLDWVFSLLCDETTWGKYSKALQSGWIRLFSGLYDDVIGNPEMESRLIAFMRAVSPENLIALSRAAYPTGGGRQAVCAQYIRDVLDGKRTF